MAPKRVANQRAAECESARESKGVRVAARESGTESETVREQVLQLRELA